MSTCATCRFWGGDLSDREEPHHGWGMDCRRRAPRAPMVVVFDPKHDRGATFPQTTADDWCGDFEPMRPPPPKECE